MEDALKLVLLLINLDLNFWHFLQCNKPYDIINTCETHTSCYCVVKYGGQLMVGNCYLTILQTRHLKHSDWNLTTDTLGKPESTI